MTWVMRRWRAVLDALHDRQHGGAWPGCGPRRDRASRGRGSTGRRRRRGRSPRRSPPDRPWRGSRPGGRCPAGAPRCAACRGCVPPSPGSGRERDRLPLGEDARRASCPRLRHRRRPLARGAPANREDARDRLGAAHQLRRLRGHATLRWSASRGSAPGTPAGSGSRRSRRRRAAGSRGSAGSRSGSSVGVGREEHERRRRDAGLGRVPDLRPAPADHRRRGALDRRRDQPVELAGRDAPSSLAPHVDRELEHLLHALAGLGADRDDRARSR